MTFFKIRHTAYANYIPFTLPAEGRRQHGAGGIFSLPASPATRLRRRSVGTRFSPRPGAGCAQVQQRCFRTAFARCFFQYLHAGQRRPPTPVPLMALGFRLCSASRRRIAGRIVVLFFQRRSLALCRRRRFSDFALVSLPALLPSRRRPSIRARDSRPLPEPHPECRPPPMPVLPAPLCRSLISLPALVTNNRIARFLCRGDGRVRCRLQVQVKQRNIYALLIIYPLFNRRSAPAA